MVRPSSKMIGALKGRGEDTDTRKERSMGQQRLRLQCCTCKPGNVKELTANHRELLKQAETDAPSQPQKEPALQHLRS